MKFERLSVIALVAVITLVGCTAGPRTPVKKPAAGPPASTIGMVKLTAADAGKSVKLVVGQVLELKLQGNPTTGFLWEPKKTPGIRFLGSAFKPNSNLIGAPGIVTLRFKTETAGRRLLTVVYRRPFEKTVPPARTFTVNLIVK